MGGEREQLESVEEILMGDEKFLSGGEGELLILGEELLEEGEEERWRGEEEGETWISRTLVAKHRVRKISRIFILPGFSVFPGYLLQTPFCTAPAHGEPLFCKLIAKKLFFNIDPNLGHENSVLQKLWVVEVNGVLRRGVRDMTRGPGHVL